MKYQYYLFILFFLFISCEEEPPEAIETYSLQVTVNPEEGGTVTPTSGTFNENEQVSIKASPSPEYVFSDWTGSTSSQSNPLTVIMNSDKSLVANFNKRTYPLTINIEGEGTVSETSQSFESGSEVTLTAIPDQGWKFVEWKGDIISTDNPITIVVNSSKEITAVFEKLNLLSLIISGQGTIEKRIDGELTEDSLFSTGTTIELTAIPNENWEFKEWTGDITSTENPVQITIEESKTVNLKFMRYYNYNVSSHDWENYHAPWFNLARITDSLGFTKKDSYNTNAAYADFNFDGYIDIMIQPNVNDGVPVESFFLINSGLNTFFIDNNFPITYQTTAISSRKTIVGDFNGDGKPDVVRPQGGHDWLGKPTITLSQEDNSYVFKLIGNGPEVQPHTLSSGDIDSDGDLDIFFAQAGEFDGFLINDGNANFTWKWISEVIEDFESGYLYPNDKYGAYGFWSSEITDVDKDGFEDLILGGSYKDEEYDSGFDGPTILWGNGSGKYFSKISTTLFNDKNINYFNTDRISLSHDYSVNDINNDGINDIALFSDLRNDDNGVFYQVIIGQGNREFLDRTNDLLPDYYRTAIGGNHVWVLLKDIDNDGNMNLVEGEPVLSIQSGFRNSLNWNWNGTKFQKIN